MTESKTELLAWVNDLLQVNYLRIEQCGSGAAYCQIMDTIYGDVAMAKVKFNSRHEYDFLNNYKILQCTFNNHKIDKDIPVERLAKCKLNDNLEFLQWLKKFWDSHRPSVTTYNAAARRSSRERSQQSGSPAASISPMDATPATRSPGSARRKSAPPPRTRSATPVATTAASRSPDSARPLPLWQLSPSAPASRAGSRPQSPRRAGNQTDSNSCGGAEAGFPPRGRPRGAGSPAGRVGAWRTEETAPAGSKKITSRDACGASSTGSLGGSTSRTTLRGDTEYHGDMQEPLAGSSTSSPEQERKVKELTKQIMDLKTIGDTLERERNFYYLKLRDIEVLILARLDKDKKTDPILRKIQTILYSTEEGFVSPRQTQPADSDSEDPAAVRPLIEATSSAQNLPATPHSEQWNQGVKLTSDGPTPLSMSLTPNSSLTANAGIHPTESSSTKSLHGSNAENISSAMTLPSALSAASAQSTPLTTWSLPADEYSSTAAALTACISGVSGANLGGILSSTKVVQNDIRAADSTSSSASEIAPEKLPETHTGNSAFPLGNQITAHHEPDAETKSVVTPTTQQRTRRPSSIPRRPQSPLTVKSDTLASTVAWVPRALSAVTASPQSPGVLPNSVDTGEGSKGVGGSGSLSEAMRGAKGLPALPVAAGADLQNSGA